MDPGHNPHFQNPFYAGNVSISDTGGGGGESWQTGSQWSSEETRDLLTIRAELDPSFMETKRNKALWDVISTRMIEMGYNRAPEQCKCKWKNLVTQYKGCETMEGEGMRQQFPFYNEMQTIYTARMERMLWLEMEHGGAATTKVAQFSSSAEDDQNDDPSERDKGRAKKKRKIDKGNTNVAIENPTVNGIREMMREFTRRQMEMEMQWLRAYEEREEKRILEEMKWRQKMEEMENERLMMNKRLMEIDEQRKNREEVRAEKRDALINSLLNKLIREGM